MDDLIEALELFKKYENSPYPTGCEHDTLYVYVAPENVSEEDLLRLEGLGFNADEEAGHFYSFKYGSA